MADEYKPTGYGNHLCERKNFKISFSPNTANMGVWSGTGPETALIVDGVYYILDGDFRKEYEGKTLAEAVQFFNDNAEHKSRWSNGP